MRSLALTEVCCGCCPLAPSPELRRKLMLPGAFRRVRLPGPPPRLVVMPLPSAETSQYWEPTATVQYAEGGANGGVAGAASAKTLSISAGSHQSEQLRGVQN